MRNFWAAPRSLVATQGISVDFCSSGYLDISVPRVRLAGLCIHPAILLAEWVSPFGHRRINARCQLPDAFRRLPRPSSPLTAKASTVCALSLDHITPSRLGAVKLHSTTSSVPSGTRLSLYDTSGPSVSNARYVPNCQRTTPQPQRRAARQSSCARVQPTGGARRARTADPLLAKQVLSQLSYGPRVIAPDPSQRTPAS